MSAIRWDRTACAAVILLMALTVALGCDGENTRRAADGPTSQEGTPAMVTSGEPAKHKHTNRLINATSPYLLQHAHNPVDWYPWGPEAIDRAMREDKPIFLSIGYSACHWCHVMERESFENEAIAAVMNEHYVCIKVDREERPDLDDIYMKATQALTHSGGWPMSVWLTPDQKPFYAGTYFPPTSRYGRPGFVDVLVQLSRAYREEHDKVLQQADQLTEVVRQLTRVVPTDEAVPQAIITRTTDAFLRAFDPIQGGMSGGGTNKFPPSMSMDLMLRAYHASLADGKQANTKLLELVELTLEKMAHGGIFDHLGGGIARYSTDKNWLVPHFEKMLYDQALVSDIYLKAFQLTAKPLYAETARAICDYVIEDLQSPGGGFYSTRDADSEGVEGKFYVWTRAEVERVLDDDAGLFCDYYDVSATGNWEGHNVLNVQRSAEAVAKMHNLSTEPFEQRLAGARKRLFAQREKRVKPHLDDKILSGWNGLMIASLAKGSRILGEPRYRDAAIKAADFVLTHMSDGNGRLLRTSREGKAHTFAYLDDYAFMIEAALFLYETTFDAKWLDHAERLNEQLMRHYLDAADGGFFYTADDAEEILVRAKGGDDNAIPSGSSVQLMNLQRLAVLLGRKEFANEAERMIRAFSGQLNRSPFSSERMLSALDFYHRRPKEIAFVCKAGDTAGADALVDAAWRTYGPNAVFARLVEDAKDADATAARIPLLVGKKTLDGKATAYVCENYACQAPTTDSKALVRQIGASSEP